MSSVLSILTDSRAYRCIGFASNISVLRCRRFRENVIKRINLSTCSSSEQPKYRTRLTLPPDYENVLDFLCSTYYKDEPTLMNLGYHGPPSDFVYKLIYELVKEGMTIVAEDCKTNCIIGAIVNSRCCPWTPDEEEKAAKCCCDIKERHLLEFYAYVARKPDLWQRFCVYNIFECSYLAVDSNYRNMGIARKLIHESWRLARDCGYRLFRLDCTHKHSSKIAAGYGFRRICVIPYCEFVKDGETVFKCIKEPHTEIHVYIDRLTYCESNELPYRKQNC